MVGSANHTALALRAAEEGIVLLSNQRNTLPLAPPSTGAGASASIAVIGPIANTTTGLLGDYAGSPPSIVSVLEGIQVRVTQSGADVSMLATA